MTRDDGRSIPVINRTFNIFNSGQGHTVTAMLSLIHERKLAEDRDPVPKGSSTDAQVSSDLRLAMSNDSLAVSTEGQFQENEFLNGLPLRFNLKNFDSILHRHYERSFRYRRLPNGFPIPQRKISQAWASRQYGFVTYTKVYMWAHFASVCPSFL